MASVSVSISFFWGAKSSWEEKLRDCGYCELIGSCVRADTDLILTADDCTVRFCVVMDENDFISCGRLTIAPILLVFLDDVASASEHLDNDLILWLLTNLCIIIFDGYLMF